jgi:hypothetical protein
MISLSSLMFLRRFLKTVRLKKYQSSAITGVSMYCTYTIRDTTANEVVTYSNIVRLGNLQTLSWKGKDSFHQVLKDFSSTGKTSSKRFHDPLEERLQIAAPYLFSCILEDVNIVSLFFTLLSRKLGNLSW